MTSLIAGGGDNGGDALLGHREKVVRFASGSDCVEGNLVRSTGSVFESYRHGKSRGQLPMNL